MNKPLTLPILAVLLGVVGGVLRGMSLLNGYEPETLLPISGDIFQTALIAVCVISAIIFGFIAFRNSYVTDFEAAFTPKNPLSKTVNIISAFVLIIGGGAGIYLSTINQSTSAFSRVSEFALWILAVASGAAIIFITGVLGRNALSEANSNFIINPMFWAVFDLIVVFKNNASSPFVGVYSFKLFPAIFLTLAFYFLAGFLYSKPKPKMFVLMGCLAVLFSFTQVIGSVIAGVSSPSMWELNSFDIARYICIIGGAVWTLSLVTNLLTTSFKEQN